MPEVSQPMRLLFVYLARPRISRSEMEADITELWQLVETMGNAQVVDLMSQHGKASAGMYIGSGKVAQVLAYLLENDIDTVVLNGILKPSQKFALTKIFWEANKAITVWDRIDLILAIFSRHAKTTEAKLQIELARMQHMGPRMYGLGLELSRQGGGIGTRGLGETNIELMQRHWQHEIKKVEDKLTKLNDAKKEQIEHRKRLGLKTVSIVGYTNAGKTSLFNCLTRKKHLVEDALFATLDSTVGELYLTGPGQKVLISDTIGFISNLPPSLIRAFKSTLMESVHADVILHVTDASDPDIREKIRVVGDILDQLGIPEKKEILVFNKIDAVPKEDHALLASFARGLPYTLVSAKTGEGADHLLTVVSSALE